MESFGTGVRKMKRLMGEYGLKEPEFSEKGNFFVVKFYGPGDKILDLVSDIPDDRKTDLKELGLNDRQVEALRMMVNEDKTFTNSLYQKTFSVSQKTPARDLKKLLTLNQISVYGKGRSTNYKAV
ncbi:MAG: hypothetical protein NKF70_13540 [Methanobacterium sp. ERen5]|nr:MAG: hypothetical protein NKF70_13540 [Methanobacterium sp. ERen5]